MADPNVQKSEVTEADDPRLSVASIIIGVIGCVIITASSVYTALKMGALPWPTIFTSILAMVILRAFGRRSLNEANVTQIIMSAGSMVAGGLAFTIPGIWMLGLKEEVGWLQMLFVALAGTLLGLVATALIRKHFIEESELEYPIGVAAAETLEASDVGGKTAKRLFGSMAFAGVWTLARDIFGLIPAVLFQMPIGGVAFGIYNSPMMLSVGFLVGGIGVLFWLFGALFANFGLVLGCTALGWWDLTTAQGIVSSLGMGLMMGSGIGVLVRNILPTFFRAARSGNQVEMGLRKRDTAGLGVMVAAAALVVAFGLGFSPLTCLAVVLLSFVTAIMSAQSVGETGIDPMEVFGLIVLLAVAALGESSQVRLFYVAGVIAVACGLGGDVMSDFKTGYILGTNPRAMWKGQAIGAILGCVVSALVMVLLVSAYGADAFGPGKTFVAAQASVVATMISGIPSLPTFVIGLLAGIVLYCLGLPAMMFSLGVYLPIYLSMPAAIGALVKWVFDREGARRAAEGKLGEGELSYEDTGTIMVSGLLGGESIIGVCIALVSVIQGFMG